MIVTASYTNLGESFESWAYKSGFLRRVHELEKRQFLESDIDPETLQRVYRLTDAGKLLALGGRDPRERWGRAWDGKWRLVLFDIPIDNNKTRLRLRRILRQHHFGCLQQSVWLSPDPLAALKEKIDKDPVAAKVFVCLEAQPCAGEMTEDIVKAAWNFSKINDAYQEHIQFLNALSKNGAPTSWQKLQDWLEQEKILWENCLKQDPLLPRSLLPKDYLGEKSWATRLRAMQQISNKISATKAKA
ncbi:MAG: PaaX family transcriptional regulator C-terminal domain-containing protein [Terrimicrobiaceae bacterium]